MFGNDIQLLKNAANWKLVSRIGDAGDGGSAYLKREDTGETAMNIRHSTFVVKANGNRKGLSVDRHSVEIVQTVYGTAGLPDTVRKAYFVVENDRGDPLANAQDVAGAVQEFLTDANVLKLLGFES